MVRKKQENVVAARLSDVVYKMMQEAITVDLHVTNSEFVRDALKEYIKNNWPEIFEKYRGSEKK